jgi:radical SAM/Cys-rich protein
MLNLVYNPQGASLPPPQATLEEDYRRVLGERYGVVFNQLYTLANMPIQRFGAILMSKGELGHYLELLRHAHVDANLAHVMCRYTLSVGWDGSLYDCDFNQMLDLGVDHGAPRHLRDFSPALHSRRIVTGQHCFGCTAGSGSSCGGITAG